MWIDGQREIKTTQPGAGQYAWKAGREEEERKRVRPTSVSDKQRTMKRGFEMQVDSVVKVMRERRCSQPMLRWS